MQFSIFAASIILAGTTSAQTVEWTDVPNICRPACAYTINLSQGCSHNTNEAYLDCTCKKTQSPTWVPNCEACVATFWDSDNDVKSLREACSFTATTWTGVTTATGSETAAATGAAETTSTSSGSSTTAGSATASSTDGSTAVGATSVSTPASISSPTPSQFTGAAAPLATAGVGMVALLMGLPVML
ncbi:hypothetical protein B0J12DRAFT_698500 [Macrophomina phaseolina]|uniref:Extracellular membrane protein CFEM domain-containing protein n=1 Tax=Macrophomina phaseolina TaxID=35725 RepID=A0ABQ8GEY5_9PEZI|nr:hypothetical protein B0J12DRAFT_698500 [Macrophomina phaseolina]